MIHSGMMNKPFAESCAQNREPIASVLIPRLAEARLLLEIGSGTGQHAVYFAPDLPQLSWQTSDLSEHHAGIRAWLEDASLPNLLTPLRLDVTVETDWPEVTYDAVFTANTVHIMGHEAVAELFSGVGRVLRPGGLFMIYGPFNYEGRYTSESNARFDQWLKQRDPQSGIKDLDWLSELAAKEDMALVEDLEMPVNNRFLVWHRM